MPLLWNENRTTKNVRWREVCAKMCVYERFHCIAITSLRRAYLTSRPSTVQCLLSNKQNSMWLLWIFPFVKSTSLIMYLKCTYLCKRHNTEGAVYLFRLRWIGNKGVLRSEKLGSGLDFNLCGVRTPSVTKPFVHGQSRLFLLMLSRPSWC